MGYVLNCGDKDWTFHRRSRKGGVTVGWHGQGRPPGVGETCSELGKVGRIWKAKQEGPVDKAVYLMVVEGGKDGAGAGRGRDSKESMGLMPQPRDTFPSPPGTSCG